MAVEPTSELARAGTAESAPPSLSDRRYREMLSASLDLLDQGVTVFDRELRLIACNRTFLELLDFPPEMARPGIEFAAFIRHNALRGEYGPGDPEAQVAERVKIARAFQAHEVTRRRPDGRLLLIRGFPLPHQGFIALYSDITEQDRQEQEIARGRVEAEEHIRLRTAELTAANIELTAAIEANRKITAELRHSEARLRDITDKIPAHIAYFDDRGIYRFANKHYASRFGWTPESIVGRPIGEGFGQALADLVQEHARRALGGEVVTYEYALPLPGGEIHHARSTLLPDRAPDGSVRGCYVHAIDISDERRTQAALAQAQKMEAIGQLTGGLAHDFNNMLTVVMGNLAGLAEGLADSPLKGEFVDPALAAAGRGAELIKRLLAFSRKQQIDPCPVDVNQMVLDMARLIRRSLPEGVRLTSASLDGDLVVMADPHQLDSAVLNLVINARDAMPNGGTLTIETSRQHIGGRDAEDLELAPGEYVQIAVNDNGIGMDGETMARIFEPFFTTKKFGMGCGLGMAMVYGFLKQSGGSVRIRSRQAVGTTVALLLPSLAAPAERRSADTPCSRAENAALQGSVVLLVEDDPEVRRVVRGQLSALGCSVMEAENGNEASDLVENVEAITLVVSDVVMPGGMDGRALARFVRRIRPQLPVLLMSGYTDDQELDGENPAVPILSKPFSREALAEALCGLLG